MKTYLRVLSIASGLFFTGQAFGQSAPSHTSVPGSKSLTAIMTNTASGNTLEVFDSATQALLQSIDTGGNGGVAGNARGLRQYNNKTLAVVNNGSGTVSIFDRVGDKFILAKTIETTSAPVSVDFGNNHLYVAGTNTVDSYLLSGDRVTYRDGSASLLLAEGGTPAIGNTSQVGALRGQVLVTLKTDPTPGTVDVIPLDPVGAINGPAKAVAGPTGSLTPFGFTVVGDDTALITLAHSGQVGLFRDGQFKQVITSGGQGGPCWTSRLGKYVMVVNSGSKTISREIATGSQIFIDTNVAFSVQTGGNPTDIDINAELGAVIDGEAGANAHLSFFKVNGFGEYQAIGKPLDLGTANANGVAVLAPLK